MKKSKKKPLAVQLVIDLLLTGVALVVFSLFHHVLPRAYETGQSYEETRPSVSQSDALYDFSSSSDAAAQIGFADKFSESVIVGDNSYTSSNVSITLSTGRMFDSTYYVEDIYIRDITCLRTAMAKDTFGTGIVQTTPVMAKNNNALCAINGDYYGARKSGAVIRNGIAYRSRTDSSKNAVCVLFKDGTMNHYSVGRNALASFDAEAMVAEGAWQAWDFGPALLNNGEPLTEFDSQIADPHPRTAIGYFEPGHYCFVTVDGRSKESWGMTMEQLAGLMSSLGCRLAYNLDGGASSVMTYGEKTVNKPNDGGRKVSDIIYICEP